MNNPFGPPVCFLLHYVCILQYIGDILVVVVVQHTQQYFMRGKLRPERRKGHPMAGDNSLLVHTSIVYYYIQFQQYYMNWRPLSWAIKTHALFMRIMSGSSTFVLHLVVTIYTSTIRTQQLLSLFTVLYQQDFRSYHVLEMSSFLWIGHCPPSHRT